MSIVTKVNDPMAARRADRAIATAEKLEAYIEYLAAMVDVDLPDGSDDEEGEGDE